jgi:regulator of telomere elongation helicase 1
MDKVIEALQTSEYALLESPTGTGKTLCLLCATLAWREWKKSQAAVETRIRERQRGDSFAKDFSAGLAQAQAEKAAAAASEEQGSTNQSIPTIVYSSRTHSQLAQVMKELKSTNYQPRTAVLGSRQQTCQHPVVSAMESAAAVNSACQSLTSKRSCKWHYGVERFMKTHRDINTQVMDIEDIIKFGNSKTLCPYYLSREMAKNADIVFMPYNYLIDTRYRGGVDLQGHPAILIFDEAHNVEGVCSQVASFDLSASVLAGSIEEIGTAIELAVAKSESDLGASHSINPKYGGGEEVGNSFLKLARDLHKLQLVLQALEKEIAAIPVTVDKPFTAPGSYLFDLFSKINLKKDTFLALEMMLSQALTVLSADAVENGRKVGARVSTYRLSALAESLKLAFAVDTNEKQLGYRVHLHMEKSRGDRLLPTLSFWCFDPGQAFSQIIETMNIHSILLTSGTLSPLNSFAQELGLPFHVRLENPHVIDEKQVWIGVVPYGPSGVRLNSSYQTREDKRYKEDLGNAIVNFARIIPDGILVFFPSYAVMKSCTDSWKQPRVVASAGPCVWDSISAHKPIVMEPRETSQFPQAAKDFQSKVNGPMKGAVLFAVCRGKASEGIDFSDNAGRAVIITGIPYATKTDAKVKIKQDVLNSLLRMGHKRPPPQIGYISSSSAGGGGGGGGSHAESSRLSGDEWYVQQALRAVNQAMGRVIRHKNDYGAIILCDERLGADGIKRHMSKWLRGQVVKNNTYGEAVSSLATFFKRNCSTFDNVGGRGGGQIAVPGGPSLSSGEGRSMNNPFQQVAAGRANTTRGGGGSNTTTAQARSLLQSVPLAIDMVGITDDLLGIGTQSTIGGRGGGGGNNYSRNNSAASSSHRLHNHNCEDDNLLEMLGDGGRGNNAITANNNNISTAGQPSQITSLKPWERQMYNNNPLLTRPKMTGVGNGSSAFSRNTIGGPQVAPTTAATIGPVHLVKRHQDKKGKQPLVDNGKLASASAPVSSEEVKRQRQAEKQEKSLQLLKMLKEGLPSADHQAVLASLKKFRNENDRASLLNTVQPLFKKPGREALWEKFQSIFSKEADTTTAAAGGGGIKGQQTRPGCCVCKNGIVDAPCEAACGHVACYSCWLKVYKCPTCNHVVTKKNLIKKIFT